MAPRKAPRKSLFGSQKWYFPDFPFRGSVGGRAVRTPGGLQKVCAKKKKGGSFLLTGKSFLLTVGLCCLRSIGSVFFTYGLVFFAYGGN